MVTAKLSPSLRVELDSLYWQTNIIDKEGDPVLATPAGFKNYFRGVYFRTEKITTEGSMLLLNIASINSHITLYYKSGDEGSREQNTYVLDFSDHILNTFINEYNFPLKNGDKISGDDELYLRYRRLYGRY